MLNFMKTRDSLVIKAFRMFCEYILFFIKIIQIEQKTNAIAEDEPMLKRIEKKKKEDMISIVDDDIDREMYNCEISEHILERIREETVLIKEKVKEIHKVV